MARRVKILFLINSLQPAGAETFVLHHVRHLDRSYYDPIVCHLRPGGELLKAFKALGIEVICLNEQHRPDWRTFLRLYRLLRNRRVDVLQTHVLYSGILGRIVGGLARVPVIVSTEQDLRLGTQANRPFVRFLNDVTLPLATANIYITKAVANSFKRSQAMTVFGTRRLQRVIPNGIEITGSTNQKLAKSEQMRASLGLSNEHFVIGNVGRLDPQKGQRFLIDAFAEVLTEIPHARLVIAGWGTLRDELNAQVSRLALSREVLFLGKRTDVLDILPCFDVFAFPSIYEGQGIAILEAMVSRIPVVASRVDGIVEIVTDGVSGLLVEAENAKDLKNAILKIADDPDLGTRLVSNACAVVQQHYSIQGSVRQYDLLYKRLSQVLVSQPS